MPMAIAALRFRRAVESGLLLMSPSGDPKQPLVAMLLVGCGVNVAPERRECVSVTPGDSTDERIVVSVETHS